jgi:hypothetical protein
MSKRGCLNCHFFCAYGKSESGDPLFVEPVESEVRNRENFVEKLKELSRTSQSPWSIKCFCGNWDAEKIGVKNTDEIIRAVFRSNREKCSRFSKYDIYATPLAVKERDDLKLEKIDKRIALILSILSIIISILLPLITSWLF